MAILTLPATLLRPYCPQTVPSPGPPLAPPSSGGRKDAWGSDGWRVWIGFHTLSRNTCLEDATPQFNEWENLVHYWTLGTCYFSHVRCYGNKQLTSVVLSGTFQTERPPDSSANHKPSESLTLWNSPHAAGLWEKGLHSFSQLSSRHWGFCLENNKC